MQPIDQFLLLNGLSFVLLTVCSAAMATTAPIHRSEFVSLCSRVSQAQLTSPVRKTTNQMLPAQVTKTTEDYLDEAAELIQKKQFNAAIATYHRAIEQDPQNEWVYFELGHLLTNQKRFAEAIPVLQRAIALNPQNLHPYVDLSSIYTEQQQWNDAIAVYRQWIAVDPQSIQPYWSLGTLLTRQNKLDEALAAFRTYIDLAQPRTETKRDMDGNPVVVSSEVQLFDDSKVSQAATAYFYLGNALAAQNQLETAITTYRKALQLDTHYAYAYDALGLALQQQGKIEAAIAAFRQAIASNPKHPDAQVHLKRAESLMKNRSAP